MSCHSELKHREKLSLWQQQQHFCRLQQVTKKNKTEEENKEKGKKDKKGKLWEYKRATEHSCCCRLDSVVIGVYTAHVTSSLERMEPSYFVKG
jgi:hypothetical protein